MVFAVKKIEEVKTSLAAGAVVRCIHCGRPIEYEAPKGWLAVEGTQDSLDRSYCSVTLKDGKAVINRHRPATEPTE